MKTNYTAVVEKCTETGLFVGHVPGFPGCHSQGATRDELHKNLQEVLEMLLFSNSFGINLRDKN